MGEFATDTLPALRRMFEDNDLWSVAVAEWTIEDNTLGFRCDCPNCGHAGSVLEDCPFCPLVKASHVVKRTLLCVWVVAVTSVILNGDFGVCFQ